MKAPGCPWEFWGGAIGLSTDLLVYDGDAPVGRASDLSNGERAALANCMIDLWTRFRDGNRVPATTAAENDPIFGAIENHKKLERTWLDLERARDARPRTTVKRRDVDRASAAEDKAAFKMARTMPTTVAGVSALLTYITTEPITGLFELGETRWHEAAFRTVTAALAKITGQSQRAA